jgi:hypothetical protein
MWARNLCKLALARVEVMVLGLELDQDSELEWAQELARRVLEQVSALEELVLALVQVVLALGLIFL